MEKRTSGVKQAVMTTTTKSSPVGTTGSYLDISRYSAIGVFSIHSQIPDIFSINFFQSSLRDFSMGHANPGLRPGLSSAVPTGLILHSFVLTRASARVVSGRVAGLKYALMQAVNR
jgi:hypothetical protein